MDFRLPPENPLTLVMGSVNAAQKEAREAGRGLWGLGSQTSKQPSATTGKYVGSKESDKYHLPTCRWVEKIKADNQVWFKDADDAKAKGYVPCGVCKP